MLANTSYAERYRNADTYYLTISRIANQGTIMMQTCFGWTLTILPPNRPPLLVLLVVHAPPLVVSRQPRNLNTEAPLSPTRTSSLVRSARLTLRVVARALAPLPPRPLEPLPLRLLVRLRLIMVNGELIIFNSITGHSLMPIAITRYLAVVPDTADPLFAPPDIRESDIILTMQFVATA